MPERPELPKFSRLLGTAELDQFVGWVYSPTVLQKTIQPQGISLRTVPKSKSIRPQNRLRAKALRLYRQL